MDGILAPILTSTAAFSCVNYASSWLVPASLVRESERKKWRGCFVGAVHAASVALAVIYTFCRFPSLLSDLKNTKNELATLVVCMSMGYFVYDFGQLVINKQFDTECMEYLIHHSLVIGGMLTGLLVEQFVACLAFGLIVEVNSVCINLRIWMHMVNVSRQALIYRINCYINIVTCVTCRLAVHTWLFLSNVYLCDTITFSSVCAFAIPLAVLIMSTLILYRFIVEDCMGGYWHRDVEIIKSLLVNLEENLSSSNAAILQQMNSNYMKSSQDVLSSQ